MAFDGTIAIRSRRTLVVGEGVVEEDAMGEAAVVLAMVMIEVGLRVIGMMSCVSEFTQKRRRPLAWTIPK